MSKFKAGDVVVVGGSFVSGTNWQKLDANDAGKVGIVRSVCTYPSAGLITDYFLTMSDGTERNFEENYLTSPSATKEADPVAKESTPRVKYLYVVEDNGVAVFSTFDREEAREEKAFLGGKAEGVIITAYAPVKEIR